MPINESSTRSRTCFVRKTLLQYVSSVILWVLVVVHVSQSKYASGQSDPVQECAYRSSDADETTLETVLFCKIRKLISLDSLLANVSHGRLDDLVFNLNVQCSDILFFESFLSSDSKNATSSHQRNLADHLKYLKIDKCKIRQIPANAFVKFKDLKRLHVATRNSDWSAMVMDLNEKSFTGLNELSELDLSNNNLWNVPLKTFCPLYSLKNLNLSQNHLQNVMSLGFSELADGDDEPEVRSCNMIVEVLDLSKNDFISLPKNGFSKLRSLVKLYLQENALSMLDDNALHGLSSLQVLNISSNFLTSLPPEIFQDCREVKQIYLSNNSLNVLPMGIFEGLDHLQVLDLSYNDLTNQWVNQATFTGLVRLIILNLSFNNIRKIDVNLFQDLYSLQILNLDHNKIEIISSHSFSELKNLHALTLSYNKLKQIEPFILNELSVLRQLCIDNNEISVLDSRAFENLTSLEDLVISSNYLSSVPDTIKHLHYLKSLDIGNNNITHIRKENFEGLHELFGLRIVDNLITFLSHDTFSHMPLLQVLNLASNKIRVIETRCLQNNNNLKAIRIDGNELTHFTGIFEGLNSLVWLNMSDNKILSLDLRNIPANVEWLDMHKNKIHSLLSSDISPRVNIKHLDLSYNNIKELKVTSLPNSVEKLYLNNNEIMAIEIGTFSKMWRLSSVSLTDNKFTTLDLNSFRLDSISSESDLPDFYLGGNSLTCDCSMEWIQRINHLSHSKQYPRVLDLDKVTCYLNNSRSKDKKKVIATSPSDFLCPYESHCFALCHCCDFDACDCEMICPQNCTCYHDITWTANVVDCSNAGYTQVPERIPMDATEIYLDGNEIKELGSHVFIGKKKLEVLYLNSTSLKEVNNQTFKGVESLMVLHLENNKLVELRGDEFIQLRKLKELYLDHNAISHIGNETFAGMSSLTILKIDENNLMNFSPWQLLASATHNAHVTFEGNKWSCDCRNIVKLESWLRNKSGDPEKMFCSDEKGNPTTITIASVLSRCTEYIGDRELNSIIRNDIVTNSISLQDNYVALFAGVLIVVITLFLIAAVFYAFRHEVRHWLHCKCGFPLFKEQTCTSSDHYVEGFTQLFDFYVICNTKDSDFVNHTLLAELEYRGFSSRKSYSNERFSNLITLDNFSKSPKSSKRLLILLTHNFIIQDLEDYNFKNSLHSYLRGLSKVDSGRIVFILFASDGEISFHKDLKDLVTKYKYLVWDETSFWEKLRVLLTNVDGTYSTKTLERNTFTNTSKSNPNIMRYTTMPVNTTNYTKQVANSSLRAPKSSNLKLYIPEAMTSRNVSLPSSSDNSSYGDFNNSTNSYMSIDSKGCARFNYDTRQSPSGHVYTRVDEITPPAFPHIKPHLMTGPTAAGRTYFV